MGSRKQSKLCPNLHKQFVLKDNFKLDSTNINAVEFCECLIAYFYSKIPFKNRICSLVFRVHLSCDFRLLFLIKFGEILIFLAENLVHGSQKNLAQNVNTFAFLSCQMFVVDHSKTSSFLLLKLAVKSFFATVSPLFIIFEKLRF